MGRSAHSSPERQARRPGLSTETQTIGGREASRRDQSLRCGAVGVIDRDRTVRFLGNRGRTARGEKLCDVLVLKKYLCRDRRAGSARRCHRLIAGKRSLGLPRRLHETDRYRRTAKRIVMIVKRKKAAKTATTLMATRLTIVRRRA